MKFSSFVFVAPKQGDCSVNRHPILQMPKLMRRRTLQVVAGEVRSRLAIFGIHDFAFLDVRLEALVEVLRADACGDNGGD